MLIFALMQPDDIFIFVMRALSLVSKVNRLPTMCFPRPSRIMRSIMAARVVLHIREFSAGQVGVGALGPSDMELSNMKFHS
jgi:hypothetical protein